MHPRMLQYFLDTKMQPIVGNKTVWQIANDTHLKSISISVSKFIKSKQLQKYDIFLQFFFGFDLDNELLSSHIKTSIILCII